MMWLKFACAGLLLWLIGVAIWIGNGHDESPSDSADVAIVLGAAIDGDEPSPVFRERIEHAITLYREDRVGRIIFTGGRVTPNALSESEVAMHYAIAAGVPAKAILIETQSRTTRQNLVEALPLLRSNEFETALIVSDPLHLRRALKMAADLDIAAEASATPTTRYQSFSTKAPFLLREVYFIHHYWLFCA